MKIKGITFWEQHVEHFVIALAVLIFVVLTALQFVGNPNSIQLNGKPVGPGEVDEVLLQHARKIQAQISPSADPTRPIPDPAPVLAKFEAARAAGVSPAPTLLAVAPRISPVAGPALAPAGGVFVVATVPPPVELKTRQFFDTLPAEIVAQHEALAARLPNAPHDITWNTVFAQVDLGSVLKQWTTDNPNGARALLHKWHDGRVDPVDVKLQRQQLLEADKWSEPITLGPLPGQLNFRDELKERIDRAMRDQIIASVADPAGRSQVLQPEFFVGAAAAWTPHPDDTDVAPKADDVVGDLAKRLAAHTKERERIAAKLKENNCPEEAPPQEPPDKKKPPRGGGDKGGGDKGGGDGGPPGPPGGGLGGGVAGGGRGPGGDPAKADDARCKTLRKQLKKQDDQITRLQAELNKLAPDAPPPDQAEKVEPEPAPMPDVVQIWAHDINIEPGKTYRYRLMIEVYNPLFARMELMPAQKPLGEQFTIASLPSEWSEPRTAEPPLRVFITEARPAGQVGPLGGLPLGNATAEVYRFFDGSWSKGIFTVYPGDRIGSQKTIRAAVKDPADPKPALSIDYSTDWFILDVVDVAGAQTPNETSLVLIQSLTGKDIIESRQPRVDLADPERLRLLKETQIAGLGGAVAKLP